MHGGCDHGRAQRHSWAVLQPRSYQTTVTNLPDGIRTVTESDDPEVAATIKKHVADMGKRVEEGRDPGLPIESPALQVDLPGQGQDQDARMRATEKGIVVVQTSTDATAVKALQDHAAEVTDLAQRGMVAAHEAMMKNGGGMMGRGMTRCHGRTAAPALRLRRSSVFPPKNPPGTYGASKTGATPMMLAAQTTRTLTDHSRTRRSLMPSSPATLTRRPRTAPWRQQQ